MSDQEWDLLKIGFTAGLVVAVVAFAIGHMLGNL